MLLPAFVSGQCTASGPKISCGAVSFDISGFAKAPQMPAEGYYSATDPDQHQYYFSAGDVAISSVTCTNAGTPVVPTPAIQSWGGQPPAIQDTCAALGDFSTISCTNAATGAGAATTLTCAYSGGTNGRALDMMYICGPQYIAPTASQTSQSGGGTYALTFTGPAGCPADPAAGGAQGMSWGTLTLILVGVGLVVYLAGGCAYNVRYKSMSGITALPQFEFWKQIPGLVKDGLKFTWSKIKNGYGWVQEQSQGGSPNPALKDSLTKNQEGGHLRADPDDDDE